MKNVFNLIVLFAFVLCFTSCDDDERTDIPTLPVTPANLNGTWQLAEWNGQSLAEGTYCYITFNRRNKLLKYTRSLTVCTRVISLVILALKKILI